MDTRDRFFQPTQDSNNPSTPSTSTDKATRDDSPIPAHFRPSVAEFPNSFNPVMRFNEKLGMHYFSLLDTGLDNSEGESKNTSAVEGEINPVRDNKP